MNDIHLYCRFADYIRQGEPAQREAAYAWSTAIGLQAVDGLKTSAYLNELARRNIEGEISIDEVDNLIHNYYDSGVLRAAECDDDTQEADKAAKNIMRILSVKTCDFSTKGYISVHRRIFEGVMRHAGDLRKYDITKKEWVLEGDAVNYLNWEDLRRAIDYDIAQERDFSYRGVSNDQMVAHITRFVSGLWQIHAFCEGNTRTTAVFTIQYLRSIGFDVENDLFAKHSWYFRNALVRANYKNARKGIDYTPIYLERFFRNLLLGEQWDLKNRYLHINPTNEWRNQPNLSPQTNTTEHAGEQVSSPEQVPASNPEQVGEQVRRNKPAPEQVVVEMPEQATKKESVPEQVAAQNPAQTPVQVPVSAQVPEQAPAQHLSTIHTNNQLIIQLVLQIGQEELSIKQMMERLNLKHRPNFLEYHLRPAVDGNYVCMLYPDKPRHPRQKYLLTVKGLALYNIRRSVS